MSRKLNFLGRMHRKPADWNPWAFNIFNINIASGARVHSNAKGVPPTP